MNSVGPSITGGSNYIHLERKDNNMQLQIRTKNRNNGRSYNHFNQNKKSESFNRNLNQIRPLPKDLSLFKMARTFGIEVNDRQHVRWYIKVNDNIDCISLENKFKQRCSQFSFTGKASVGWNNNRKGKQLILDTPRFLFTLDNINKFSIELLKLAKESSVFYERWDVIRGKTTPFEKLVGLFKN